MNKSRNMNYTEKTREVVSAYGPLFYEILCVFAQISLFFVRLIYYIGESLFNTINPTSPKSVSGEIVLITGTGHGIGKELALVYAAKGATVVCWDINKRNNDETVQEIKRLGNAKVYGFQCDVTNRDEVLEVAKEVKQQVGTVTILINNAGIMPCHRLEEHTHHEIIQTINVNLMAHFWLLEAFLPAMKVLNHGHIVSISSMAGLIGFENLVPYSATKFAVHGYMEALHEELRKFNPNNHIKLTCIFPFIVDTGLCKRPKVKYANLLPLLPPKQVAEEILVAQTKGISEKTLPSYFYCVNKIVRLLPIRAQMDLKDSFQTYLDSDL